MPLFRILQRYRLLPLFVLKMEKHPKWSWLPKETLSYFVLRNQLFIRLIYFPLFTSFFWILPNFNLFISVCIYSLLFRTFVQLFLVWLMFFICVFLLLLLRSVVTNCFFVCFDSKMWSCTKMWTNQFPQKCRKWSKTNPENS